MSPELSVAVVSFNTRDLTLRCVQAAEAAVAGRSATLTLVDNGSADDTVERVRESHPAWRVILAPENPGYGAALNRAFRLHPGRFLLALNADVVLGADTVARLVEALERDPRGAVAGPALRYPDGRDQPSAKRFPSCSFAVAETLRLTWLFPLAVRRFYYGDRDLTRETPVDAVAGAAMLLRGEAFAAVGGFDEGFRMYFEETDFCRRLHAAGYQVRFCPQGTAVHWHGASTHQTSVREVEYYLSYVRFVRKHHGVAAARLLTGAVAAGTVLRMIGLTVKYFPVSRRRAAVLAGKLAAGRRLLAALAAPPRLAAVSSGVRA